MPYNRDIRNAAPLPSGALPTPQEMAQLRRAAWAQDVRKFRSAVGALLGR